MKSLFIILSFIFVLFCSAQRTTRKHLKVKDNHSITLVGDTITNINDSILKISGYDKPLNSYKESFFATNNSNDTIIHIQLTFNYFDSQKRQLHSATKNINCTIPPGETRQLSISSWDKQKAFFYYRSPQPRRQATPYSVTHSIDFVVTTKSNHP